MYKKIYEYDSIRKMVDLFDSRMKSDAKTAKDTKHDAWVAITKHDNAFNQLAALALNLGSWVIYCAADETGEYHRSITWIPPKELNLDWYNTVYLPVMKKEVDPATEARTQDDWMTTKILLRFNDANGFKPGDYLIGNEAYTIYANFQELSLFDPMDAIVLATIEPLSGDYSDQRHLNWNRCLVMHILRTVLAKGEVDY